MPLARRFQFGSTHSGFFLSCKNKKKVHATHVQPDTGAQTDLHLPPVGTITSPIGKTSSLKIKSVKLLSQNKRNYFLEVSGKSFPKILLSCNLENGETNFVEHAVIDKVSHKFTREAPPSSHFGNSIQVYTKRRIQPTKSLIPESLHPGDKDVTISFTDKDCPCQLWSAPDAIVDACAHPKLKMIAVFTSTEVLFVSFK
jgi:hypothetical protein